MTGEQIRLVRDSFRRVLPVADAAALLFYARLFELDPSLRPLFAGDAAERGRSLMKTIGMAVDVLDRPGRLLLTAREVGSRHAAGGVREQEYETLRRALLWALRRVLGVEFTPEVRAAWGEAAATLAGALRAGAARGEGDAGAGALYL